LEPLPKTGIHRVTKGETLYEIAWRYGLDYRYLAQRNHIEAPFTIRTKQIIYLTGRDHRKAPVQSAAIVPTLIVQRKEREPNYSSSGWKWPAAGKIIASFSATNKGVNIANNAGAPIYAAAGGKVVYSGNGLRSYGNLIIIKHNSLYLSAYAHNRRIWVKPGDWVKKGQKIAEMGNTGSDKIMLHFEIRRAGKPINPLSLYQSTPT
jgi:lipoprotein NlpD